MTTVCRRLVWTVVPLALLLFWDGGAEASDYAEANQAYLSGRYDDAVRRYEAMVADGVIHEALYYNLGNAYFRDGKLGPAIYNYERALALDPGFEDAAYNLEVARSVVAERVVDRLRGAESDPFWVRVVTMLTPGQLATVLLSLNLVFFVLWIVLRFLAIGFVRTLLLVTNGFIGVALIGTILITAGFAYYTERVERAVILADTVELREGAQETSAARGELHPGLRVRVLVRQPGWVRVQLSNGVEGWVREDSIGLL